MGKSSEEEWKTLEGEPQVNSVKRTCRRAEVPSKGDWNVPLHRRFWHYNYPTIPEAFPLSTWPLSGWSTSFSQCLPTPASVSNERPSPSLQHGQAHSLTCRHDCWSPPNSSAATRTCGRGRRVLGWRNLDSKMFRGRLKFKIKWEGCGPEHDN